MSLAAMNHQFTSWCGFAANFWKISRRQSFPGTLNTLTDHKTSTFERRVRREDEREATPKTAESNYKISKKPVKSVHSKIRDRMFVCLYHKLWEICPLVVRRVSAANGQDIQLLINLWSMLSANYLQGISNSDTMDTVISHADLESSIRNEMGGGQLISNSYCFWSLSNPSCCKCMLNENRINLCCSFASWIVALTVISQRFAQYTEPSPRWH